MGGGLDGWHADRWGLRDRMARGAGVRGPDRLTPFPFKERSGLRTGWAARGSQRRPDGWHARATGWV